MAQRRTEERLNELAKRVDGLAVAQSKTEKRLNELAKRVNELAAAQLKTEERLNALADSVDKLVAGLSALRVEAGRLSDVVGFGLEDIARVVLPGWLHRRLGVEVEELRRSSWRLTGRKLR